MNKARRQWIERIINELETQRDELTNVQEEEQEAFDNLPESIQYSERGDAMGEYITDLDDAASSIDDVMSTLQDIIER